MRKILLLLLASFACVVLKSQTINFVLPDNASKAYVLSVYNGLKKDTIASGTVSMMGTGRIVIPEKYKGIPAMGSFEVQGESPLFLILNDESYSFAMKNGKPSFEGSIENDLLYNDREGLSDKANSATYAYFFAHAMSATSQINNVVARQNQASLLEQGNARLAGLAIDVDKLYYSQFWAYVIDGLMRMSPNEESFAKDMIQYLDKTKTDRVYKALVEDLITITGQFGLDNAFDIIIPHVEKSGRIEYPQGSIYDAFAMAKVRKGLVAPELVGLDKPLGKTDHKYSLLVFYISGCDNCHIQLKQLQDEMNYFVDKGVRIISVSADTNKELSEADKKMYSWPDQLCDLKGYTGANYRNYGVLATPTFYLMDVNKVVLGRFATISKIKGYLSSEL